MAVRENPPQWLQNFRQASFRGVGFLIDSADSQFGRNVVTHQYAERDVPFTEDLGRKARRFSMTAYLVGGDYMLARDALIEACELPGPGLLVHPYLGELQVVLDGGLTVRERRQDGGYCDMSLTFVEDGENQFPAAISNPDTAVDLTASDVQSRAASVFERAYNLANLPEFVRTEMVDAANKLLGPADRLLSISSDFSDSLAALKRDLGTLIFRPRELAAGFLGVINDITKLAGKNKATSATLHELVLSTLRLVPETTGTRTRQSRSQNAMQSMVQQMAVSEHARVVVGQPYDSYQQAIEARSELADEIDTVSETAADEVFQALQDLRAKVVQALPDPKLPEIQSVTMRQATPAIVLAYRIYGDAEREADITARNNIRHPGFIPGGSSVEVVING
jgi:prophage DNA circulation protein